MGGAVPHLAAFVSFRLELEELRDASGSPIAPSTLAVLAADTQGDGFDAPGPGLLTVGNPIATGSDDLAVALLASDSTTPGIVFNLLSNLSLTGSWKAGQPLALYWFPGATLSDPRLADLDPYGFARATGDQTGTTAWVTPADGSTVTLRYYTTAATVLIDGAAAAWLAPGLAEAMGRTGLGAGLSWEVWLTRYFSPAQLGDPGLSGAEADADSDGLSNALEYAAGSDPGFPDSETVLQWLGPVETTRWLVRSREAAPFVETSPDLVQWSPVMATAYGVPAAPGWRWWTVQTDPPGPAVFLRWRP